jgi:hypothetical protein
MQRGCAEDAGAAAQRLGGYRCRRITRLETKDRGEDWMVTRSFIPVTPAKVYSSRLPILCDCTHGSMMLSIKSCIETPRLTARSFSLRWMWKRGR